MSKTSTPKALTTEKGSKLATVGHLPKHSKAVVPYEQAVENLRAQWAELGKLNTKLKRDQTRCGLYMLQIKATLVHGQFGDWLRDGPCSDLNISRSTAYNYMAAATNCGLNALSDPKVIDELYEAGFFAQLSYAQLYSTALPAPAPGIEKGAKPTIFQMEFEDFNSTYERLEQLRDTFEPDQREQLTPKIRKTLEMWTGLQWVPADADYQLARQLIEDQEAAEATCPPGHIVVFELVTRPAPAPKE